MSRRKRIHKEGATYFITATTRNRRDLFCEKKLAEVLVRQFYHYREGYQYDLHAYVVLPDHYHLLITVDEESDISNIIHSINSYSAYRINEIKGSRRKEGIWQRDCWTEVIRNKEMYRQKLAYILANPWKEDLVDHPLEEYEFSNLGEVKQDKGEEYILDLFSQYSRSWG